MSNAYRGQELMRIRPLTRMLGRVFLWWNHNGQLRAQTFRDCGGLQLRGGRTAALSERRAVSAAGARPGGRRQSDAAVCRGGADCELRLCVGLPRLRCAQVSGLYPARRYWEADGVRRGGLVVAVRRRNVADA